MGFDFNDLMGAVAGDEFDEIPVGVEEFLYGEEYLALDVKVSEDQLTFIKAATQIYKKDTLFKIFPYEEALKRWGQTYRECVIMWGKGSGKDFASVLACCYVVYQLLCLKDPAKYYGKPSGDTIDIINVAINATQAYNVFFKNFKSRVEKAPWFMNKTSITNGQIAFDKNVTVYSGHSERESFEGYNVIFVVLDEIAGFAEEGNNKNKTAQAIYDTYRASVTSRFEEGKIILLSFPRHTGDFITKRYNEVVKGKDVLTHKYTYEMDPDNPGLNSFVLEYDEDVNLDYGEPNVFAMRRASWQVNPTKTEESYKGDFYANYTDALGRYAAQPTDPQDAFFRDRQKIETAFSDAAPLNNFGQFAEWFKPKPDIKYFVHIDLARVHDRAAVAMAHVEKWKPGTFGPVPVVKVDLLKYWTPTRNKPVDFTEVREFVMQLHSRGFDIGRITLDRWESKDLIDYFNNVGIKSERLSVAKKHYIDLATLVHEERVTMQYDQVAIDELAALRLMKNDTIDHPRAGGKDTSDAICGAVYNAISLTPKQLDRDIDVHTLEDLEDEPQRKVIPVDLEPVKRDMPVELRHWLERVKNI